jgi:hypothetical protein
MLTWFINKNKKILAKEKREKNLYSSYERRKIRVAVFVTIATSSYEPIS